MTDARWVRIAKKAATILYEENPEYVRGGCSEVSEVIARVLRRLGYKARVIYGLFAPGADPKREFFDLQNDIYEHAWVEVERERFDPTLWVQRRLARDLQELPRYGDYGLYRKERGAIARNIRNALFCFEEVDQEYVEQILEALGGKR